MHMYMQALQDYIVQQLHLLDSDLLDQDHSSVAADVVAVEKELAIVSASCHGYIKPAYFNSQHF